MCWLLQALNTEQQQYYLVKDMREKQETGTSLGSLLGPLFMG